MGKESTSDKHAPSKLSQSITKLQPKLSTICIYLSLCNLRYNCIFKFQNVKVTWYPL